MSRTHDDRYTCGENTREEKPGPFSPHLQMLLLISIHYSHTFVKNKCHRPCCNHTSTENYRAWPGPCLSLSGALPAEERSGNRHARRVIGTFSGQNHASIHHSRVLPAGYGLKLNLLLRSFELAARLAVKPGRHAVLTRCLFKYILHRGPKSMDFLQ